MTYQQSDALIINGWYIFAHPIFLDQFEQLIIQVEKYREKDPNLYKEKNATKRLVAITNLILKKIPRDPALTEYRQGATLGEKNKHWFRAKFFQQYRLFFRYHHESRIIVYAWVNDENTKRAYDSKTDAYSVFKTMLSNDKPPSDWNELFKEAQKEIKRFANYINKLNII